MSGGGNDGIVRFSIRLMLAALFMSGVAAIINQIVWQRALKVYLAGSEAISSMIVVLVFMLGLGVGAFHMGRRARGVGNPLRALGLVELGLLGINLVICFVLTLSIAESANGLQRAAASLGIPLRVVYAAVSGGILFLPCYLMGITMPLVSEASQRQFRVGNSRFLTTLFFLNTLGAVGGGLLGGFWLLPYIGQRRSLIVAAALNGVAGVVILLLRQARAKAESGPVLPKVSFRWRASHGFAFLLGFWALAYEMYLLRIGALALQPTPTTFSSVLCAYLLAWSAGLWCVRYVTVSFPALLAVTFGLCMLVPHGYYYGADYPAAVAGLALLPCMGFGAAFGRLLADTSRDWGRDVGFFYFMNTIGSCLGILTAVLLGYRIHPMMLGWIIGGAYLAMAVAAGFRLFGYGARWRVVARGGVLVALVLFTATASSMLGTVAVSFRPGSPMRSYFGPDGVVQVVDGKTMLWDGLWHSDLSDGDHVGTNNWLLGSVPVLIHGGKGDLDTLVVGLGTGITAKTLAEYPQVRSVHVYEINKSLQKLIHEFSSGTLHVASDSKIDIEWNDGRVGLVLSERKYDLVTQQPMYLKQAGSSMLLSREYMQIVKERLKPGGIFCVYCNSMGNKAQAAVVRKAAAEVFPYYESFGNGYMLALSDSPISYSREKIAGLVGALPPDSQARTEAEAYGVERYADYMDRPKLDWIGCPYPVTDDHPIVEYPEVARRLIRSKR